MLRKCVVIRYPPFEAQWARAPTAQKRRIAQYGAQFVWARGLVWLILLLLVFHKSERYIPCIIYRFRFCHAQLAHTCQWELYVSYPGPRTIWCEIFVMNVVYCLCLSWSHPAILMMVFLCRAVPMSAASSAKSLPCLLVWLVIFPSICFVWRDLWSKLS